MKIQREKTYKQEVISLSWIQALFCMYVQNLLSLWSTMKILYSLNMCPIFNSYIKIIIVVAKVRFMYRRCNYEFWRVIITAGAAFKVCAEVVSN